MIQTCFLHTPRSILHIPYSTFHTTCSILHIPYYMFHTPYFTFRTPYSILQAVRRVFSRPSDPLAGIVFEVRTWKCFTKLVTMHVYTCTCTCSCQCPLLSLLSPLLSHLISQPPFESKLRGLARSTINTRRNGGVYRNVLMYGSPGTGKTMFAKVKTGVEHKILWSVHPCTCTCIYSSFCMYSTK